MPQVKFVQSPEYIETYATSIWGGLGPKGDLKMIFAEEKFDFPGSYELIDKGNGVFEEPPLQSTNLIRLEKCMVSMPANEIPLLIKWLTERYNQYLTLTPNVKLQVDASTPDEIADIEK